MQWKSEVLNYQEIINWRFKKRNTKINQGAESQQNIDENTKKNG